MKNGPFYHLQNDADVMKQGDFYLFRQVDLGDPRAIMEPSNVQQIEQISQKKIVRQSHISVLCSSIFSRQAAPAERPCGMWLKLKSLIADYPPGILPVHQQLFKKSLGM
eukprot:2229495-Pleurochrysis_carterae.AAC.1